MRWDDFRTSSNIEDDREASASRGGGLGIPGGGGGLGIGMVIILGLVGWALGIDPSVLIGGAQILTGGGEATQQSGPAPEVDTGTPNDQTGQFVAAVLGSTEDVWTEIFAANRRTYHPPKLRLFSGSEPTPCAFARSARGHFIVRAISAFTSIPRFSTTFSINLAVAPTATPASFRKLTSSHTKSAITCKTSSASCRA